MRQPLSPIPPPDGQSRPSNIGEERHLCPRPCLRKPPVRPAATGSGSPNTVTVQWWRSGPDARVSLIAHLAPRPGSTISSALGLSFRQCPAT
jgi:hypothetical protein